jgi:hypothetical protein
MDCAFYTIESYTIGDVTITEPQSITIEENTVIKPNYEVTQEDAIRLH